MAKQCDDDLDEIMRANAVEKATGRGRTTRKKLEAEGKFPKSVPLGPYPNSPRGYFKRHIVEYQRALASGETYKATEAGSDKSDVYRQLVRKRRTRPVHGASKSRRPDLSA